MGEYIILLLIAVVILATLLEKPLKRYIRKHRRKQEELIVEIIEEPAIENQTDNHTEHLDYTKLYQRKWMFTSNEKAVYYKLKTITEKHGYFLFSKVRMLDLVEPIRNHPKYKTCFYKIQAKHVDFVLCDSRLVARYIIELDDNSHMTKERHERDLFVDSVLTSCGYKVLRIKSFDETAVEELFT